MPVVFKQTYNAFNLEFDDYLEVLFEASESGLCREVRQFGRELIRHVLQVRSGHQQQSEVPDGPVRIAGRRALATADRLKEAIDEKLDEDFPKFIGTRTNFWRYLLRLVPVFTSEPSGHDYAGEFAVATACLLELNCYCFRVGQLNLVENCGMFWNAMFLHFFGERFRGRDKCAFLQELGESRAEVEALKIVMKIRRVETEDENTSKSKKSRKKNKKRRK